MIDPPSPSRWLSRRVASRVEAIEGYVVQLGEHDRFQEEEAALTALELADTALRGSDRTRGSALRQSRVLPCVPKESADDQIDIVGERA